MVADHNIRNDVFRAAHAGLGALQREAVDVVHSDQGASYDRDSVGGKGGAVVDLLGIVCLEDQGGGGDGKGAVLLADDKVVGAILGSPCAVMVPDLDIEGGVACTDGRLASRAGDPAVITRGEVPREDRDVDGGQRSAVVGLGLRVAADGQLGEADRHGALSAGDGKAVGDVLSRRVVEDHRDNGRGGGAAGAPLTRYGSLVGIAQGLVGLKAREGAVVDVGAAVVEEVLVGGLQGDLGDLGGVFGHVHGDPADALNIDLHPCVGIGASYKGLLSRHRLGQVAHGIAGGDAQHTVDEGSGGGEVAVASLAGLHEEVHHLVPRLGGRGIGIQRIVGLQVGDHGGDGLGG